MKWLIVAISLLLASCDQYYRYSCQDPKNWGKAECQKPICEVNRDCPEYIFKNNSAAMSEPTPAPAKQGGCK